MKEFEYPMWFKSLKDEDLIVKFNGLTEGIIIDTKSGLHKGYLDASWIPHTDEEMWLNITCKYKNKTKIPTLKMCGTPFGIEEKDTKHPTIKEALKKLIKEERPSKYRRKVPSTNVDVYDILKAFNVVNPATQHAIKKLLCAGDRGYKDKVQDLKEALASIERAIELEEYDVEA